MATVRRVEPIEALPLAAARTAAIAYQPIVSMSSLRAHGFEALARLSVDSPFSTIHDLMDAAADRGELLSTERILLNQSITTFGRIEGAGSTRLFCNVDNRLFDDPDVQPQIVVDMAARAGLEAANICIELSERKPPKSMEAMQRLVDLYLRHNIRIAIDDFGRGFSGLDMLMQVNPHYVKIDRAFIDGVAHSPRRQAIVSKVVGLAHSLGFQIVAEGIETEADFRACRSLGCDLAQGYLIARPSTEISHLKLNYEAAVKAAPRAEVIPPAVRELMLEVEPLRLGDAIGKAIIRFKSSTERSLLPVVDEHGYVHGALYEGDVRHFLFGDFGAALLANRGIDQSLSRFVRRCPISEITVAPEALVDSYVVAAGNEGIVLTLDGRYVGVLGNTEMVRLAAARDVAVARDQNPLTQLPGNNSINRHLEEVLTSAGARTLVFFDFDNFKSFNDAYGFSSGDRALLIFADLLTKARIEHDLFVGHIGGDDFFMSLVGGEGAAQAIVAELRERFSDEVRRLYSPADLERGGIWAKDRYGNLRFFPPLRASAALATLPAARAHLNAAGLVTALSEGKAGAKRSGTGLIVVDIPASGVAAQLSVLRDL